MVRTGPMIALVAQSTLLAVLTVTVGLGAAGWLVGVAYGLVVNGLLAFALLRSGAPVLGPANTVTLSRATLVGGVAALVADSFTGEMSVPTLVALAAAALVLDGADGRVARRTRTASSLGAIFDQEVDAFLILVLSVHVAGIVGPWALAIGGMRYAFVVAGWLLPWLRGPVPPSYAAKTVAALQGVVLVVASAGLLPHAVTVALVAGALAALAWSFGRSVRLLWRAERLALAHG